MITDSTLNIAPEGVITSTLWATNSPLMTCTRNTNNCKRLGNSALKKLICVIHLFTTGLSPLHSAVKELEEYHDASWQFIHFTVVVPSNLASAVVWPQVSLEPIYMSPRLTAPISWSPIWVTRSPTRKNLFFDWGNSPVKFNISNIYKFEQKSANSLHLVQIALRNVLFKYSN